MKRPPEWDVPCQVCRAEAGATCRDLLGTPQTSHTNRVRAWQDSARERAALHYGGQPPDRNDATTAHGQPLPDTRERAAVRALISEIRAGLVARGHPSNQSHEKCD